MDSSDSEDFDEIIDKTFFKKYRCTKKIGQGSFGNIYEAEYDGEIYALKFEDKNKGSNLLESEAAIMNYLKGPNIPFIKSYGFTSSYNILVMQLLGDSLEDLILIRKTFSLKTVCMLGFQMITVLEYIHNKHIIHRDIKPDNFVMGLDEFSPYLYLIDFGLAKKYRSSTTLVQYPLVFKNKLTGTARYASINALRGYEHSRRDDLESIGYIFVYLLKGKLPWQGLRVRNKKDKYKAILQKKIDTTSTDLCKDLPKEFEKFIDYTKNLEFTEQPDYDYLRGLLSNVMKREGLDFDYIYDWTTEEEKKNRKKILERSDLKPQNEENSLLQVQNSKNLINQNKENSDESLIKTPDKVNNIVTSSGNSVTYNVNVYNSKDTKKESNNDNNNKKIYKIKHNGQNVNNKANEKYENKIINYKMKEKINQEEVCCSSGCNIF